MFCQLLARQILNGCPKQQNRAMMSTYMNALLDTRELLQTTASEITVGVIDGSK